MRDRFERAAALFRELQFEICAGLEELETDASARFGKDEWTREGGGGGVSRVLEGGEVFEKAGVNWSGVEGALSEEFESQIPGQGRAFRATGISLVIHPRSPRVPTTHANFRYLEKGDRRWFGGGADLTPYYLEPSDATHFHAELQAACDRHAPIGDYARFKSWCDEYFHLPHRGEARGVGGIFFDYLEGTDEELDRTYAFVEDAGRALLRAYVPIVRRRVGEPYGERERTWQLRRRGRYVEFNLLYDRGTLFGLKTKGRIESILMSLPPLVRWDYDVSPGRGSPEAELLEALREPRSWV